MIPGIEQTPPEIALILGFFVALALERKDERKLVNYILPVDLERGPSEQEKDPLHLK